MIEEKSYHLNESDEEDLLRVMSDPDEWLPPTTVDEFIKELGLLIEGKDFDNLYGDLLEDKGVDPSET